MPAKRAGAKPTARCERRKASHCRIMVVARSAEPGNRTPSRRWLRFGLACLLAPALAPADARAERSSERDFGLYVALAHAYADITLEQGAFRDAAGIRSALCVTMGKFAGIEYSEHRLRDGDRSVTLSTVSLVAEVPAARRWQWVLRYGLGNLYRDEKDGIAEDNKDIPGLVRTFPLLSPAPVYGFGAQYSWRKGWRLRAELEVFTTTREGQRHRDSTALSLGLVYQFF